MSKEISFGILQQTYGRSAVEIPDTVHTDGPNARTNILTYLKAHWDELPRCTDARYVPDSAELDEAALITVNGESLPDCETAATFTSDTIENPYENQFCAFCDHNLAGVCANKKQLVTNITECSDFQDENTRNDPELPIPKRSHIFISQETIFQLLQKYYPEVKDDKTAMRLLLNLGATLLQTDTTEELLTDLKKGTTI